MSDEIEAVTETAKAVQEVAKTGRTVIEAGSDLAEYVAKLRTQWTPITPLNFRGFSLKP